MLFPMKVFKDLLYVYW